MNGEIKRITRMKNKLRNKYWRTRERSDWEAYKDIRNGLNSIVWKAKKSYFAEELSLSKSPKEFWRNLKQNGIVNGKDNRSLPAEMKADEVNKYFSEMGQECDIDEDLLKFYKENRKDELEPAFSFMPVTEDDVKSAMNEIKSHAVGYDNVSMTMIKSVSPFAIGAITHLINKSLMSGKFPQRWKTSIVHPLPKVTTPTSYNQLRPISILPAMSKIIEKIVVRQIVNFTNERGLLPKMQSGFRKDYSTCTALTNLFAELFDARDEGLYSIIVMLDFKQAFDSVSPELLVAMLHYLGFDEGATDWIESYSCERVQVTKIGSETSRPLVKRRGVAQGSGVGPILFIIYTIALYICVRYSKVHGYVDDCQMHKPYKPGQMAAAVAEVNSDLHSVSEWSEKHGLKLNINKCTVMHIAPRESVQALSDDGVCVTLGGQSLAISAKIKTLGVELDSSLSLSDHVTHNIQKAFGRLRGMYRFKDLLPEPTKLRIIQTIVLPVFYYCYPAYGNSISKGDKDRIQRLQNSAVRFVYGLKRRDHVTPYREASNLPLMETICSRLTCCMIHKVLKKREPQYLSEKLQYREEVAQRGTRHGMNLHFPRVRLEEGRRSFSYFGPKLYNDLTENVKSIDSYMSFKKELKVVLSK